MPSASRSSRNSRARSSSQRVTVVTSKEEQADYTLRGYVVAAKDKSATKVSYIWDVTDPAGKRVNRITGEEAASGDRQQGPMGGPDAAGRAVDRRQGREPARRLAAEPERTARGRLSAALERRCPAGCSPARGTPGQAPGRGQGAPAEAGAAPVAAAPAEPATTTGSIGREGPVMAIVPSVTGAPGDGSTSLTAAIQRELSSKGVALSDKPAAVAYRVEGTVTVGEAKEGKQPIHIEWLVQRSAGQEARHRVAEERDPRRLARRRVGQDGRAGRRRRRARHHQAAAAAQGH